MTAFLSTVPGGVQFSLQAHDVELLAQSEGFTILRRHLASQYTYEPCNAHSSASADDQDRCLLVRDVLHALLVPIVELFDKACSVAVSATFATKLEDLEYAFSGPSRSAFVWLQCFLSSKIERDWCYTRGCPACVMDHTLNSEFSVRLLYAACLLSDVHYPFTMDGPTLPSFTFFLESLERAIEQDPLYGDDFFELMQPKAIATREGVEDMIRQCVELEVLLSQPSSPDPSTPVSSRPSSPVVISYLRSSSGMKIKRSKMAKRQMKLQQEEEQWMEDVLKKCVERMQADVDIGAPLTHTQSLDAVLKAQPEVSVTAVGPE